MTSGVVQLFLNSGQPLPASTRQVKVVAFYEENGALSNAADIHLEVATSSNCSAYTTQRVDDTDSLTRMVSVGTVAAGKCVRVWITPVHLPASRTVYWSYFWHTGPSEL